MGPGVSLVTAHVLDGYVTPTASQEAASRATMTAAPVTADRLRASQKSADLPMTAAISAIWAKPVAIPAPGSVPSTKRSTRVPGFVDRAQLRVRGAGTRANTANVRSTYTVR